MVPALICVSSIASSPQGHRIRFESLRDPGDGVAERVVDPAQLAVRGLELVADLVGAALLVPDDSHADHQQGDELSDGICVHAH